MFGKYIFNRLVWDRLAGWGIVCLVLALPYSTAVTNIFGVAILVFWLASGNVCFDLKRLLAANFSKFLIGFIIFVLISAAWSSAPGAYIVDGIANLRKLLLVCVIWMILTRKREFQKLVFIGYLLSCFVLSLICVGIYLNFPFFPSMTPGQGAILNRSHIAQGYMMAVGICLQAWILFSSVDFKYKIFGFVGLALEVIVTFYMTNGRTGYVCALTAIGVMALLLPIERAKKILAVLIISTLSVLVMISSDRISNRIDDAVDDIHQLESGFKSTSVGYRLNAWRVSGDIIFDNPVFGVGVGSWGTEFCKSEKNGFKNLNVCHDVIKIGNPHSDYINYLSQFGVVGFSLWVLFLLSTCRNTIKYDSPERCFMLAVLSVYFAGSAFNSFMLDFTEGTLSAVVFAWILSRTEMANSSH